MVDPASAAVAPQRSSKTRFSAPQPSNINVPTVSALLSGKKSLIQTNRHRPSSIASICIEEA
jgi:hypothetical protein